MSEQPKSAQPGSERQWNDQRIEVLIGVLLRTGVLLSAAVVLAGGGVYLATHARAATDYRTFRGALSPLRSFAGIAHGVARLDGAAIIQAGLLLLIATPIARVIFSAAAFFRERDYLYVAVTLAVLAVLVYSLLGTG